VVSRMHNAEVVSVRRGFSGDTETHSFAIEMSQNVFYSRGKVYV